MILADHQQVRLLGAKGLAETLFRRPERAVEESCLPTVPSNRSRRDERLHGCKRLHLPYLLAIEVEVVAVGEEDAGHGVSLLNCDRHRIGSGSSADLELNWYCRTGRHALGYDYVELIDAKELR